MTFPHALTAECTAPPDHWTRTHVAAVAYANLALATFPLHPVLSDGRCGCGDRHCDNAGKHPATSGWQRSIASVRAAEHIWRPGGQRGIGLACGPRSGCFVVDVDPRHGGKDTLNELLLRHGPMTGTWMSETGSGGWHLFFRWPDDAQIRNSAGKIGPGIDVRGDGGFVVLPPSPHASGSRYRWLSPPDAVDLAVAPGWLLKLAQDASRSCDRGRARAPAPMVPPGQRHDALVSLLGLLRRWEACEEVGHAAAVAFVEHQCLPDPERPISMAHVHAQVRDVWRRYR